MRLLLPAILLGLSLLPAQPLLARDPTLQGPFIGQDIDEWFGWSVANVGDVDGDSVDDFAVAVRRIGYADFSATPGDTTLVEVRSSADGSLLIAFAPGLPVDGAAVAGAGDLDGDSRHEVLVGVSGAGKAFVLAWNPSDPRTPEVRWVFEGRPGDLSFGRAVAGGGDWNEDGVADLAIASNNELRIHNGTSGAELESRTGFTRISSLAFGQFQSGGPSEIAIGDSADATDRGKVTICRGDSVNIQCHWILQGEHEGDRFGQALAFAEFRDDGSGRRELAVGAPGYDFGRGRVYLFRRVDNGQAASLLDEEQQSHLEGRNFAELFGWTLTSVPGLSPDDGDSIPELVVGSPCVPTSGSEACSEGRVSAYRILYVPGKFHHRVLPLDSHGEEGLFHGFSVAGLPDLDLDHRGEVVIGTAGGAIQDLRGQAEVRAGCFVDGFDDLFDAPTLDLCRWRPVNTFVGGRAFEPTINGVVWQGTADPIPDAEVGGSLILRPRAQTGSAFFSTEVTGENLVATVDLQALGALQGSVGLRIEDPLNPGLWVAGRIFSLFGSSYMWQALDSATDPETPILLGDGAGGYNNPRVEIEIQREASSFTVSVRTPGAEGSPLAVFSLPGFGPRARVGFELRKTQFRNKMVARIHSLEIADSVSGETLFADSFDDQRWCSEEDNPNPRDGLCAVSPWSLSGDLPLRIFEGTRFADDDDGRLVLTPLGSHSSFGNGDHGRIFSGPRLVHGQPVGDFDIAARVTTRWLGPSPEEIVGFAFTRLGNPKQSYWAGFKLRRYAEPNTSVHLEAWSVDDNCGAECNGGRGLGGGDECPPEHCAVISLGSSDEVDLRIRLKREGDRFEYFQWLESATCWRPIHTDGPADAGFENPSIGALGSFVLTVSAFDGKDNDVVAEFAALETVLDPDNLCP